MGCLTICSLCEKNICLVFLRTMTAIQLSKILTCLSTAHNLFHFHYSNTQHGTALATNRKIRNSSNLELFSFIGFSFPLCMNTTTMRQGSASCDAMERRLFKQDLLQGYCQYLNCHVSVKRVRHTYR